MKIISLSRLLMLVLFAALLAAGCSAQAAVSPTADPNQIATNAVETFAVRLSQTAPTPSQTSTQSATDEAGSAADPASAGTAPAADAVGLLAGTATPAEAGAIYIAPEDKASLISQFPQDGGEARIGRPFDVTWKVRNDGKTTWTKTYTLRYYAGAAFGESYTFKFGKDVPPGGEIDLTADMVAPNYLGTFNSIWVLTNDKGENFYQVFVTIKIIPGKTTTPSPTIDLTPAATSAG